MSQVIVVMGVSGSGKTTVGRALAAALGAVFFDADEFHTPANVAKMTRGEPLTDEDRWPWLDRLHAMLADPPAGGAVLACSALKAAYRDRLLDGLGPRARVVLLDADRGLVRRRMAGRTHFMPVALVDSQFDTLERPAPGEALVVDASWPVEAIVREVVGRLPEG